MSRDYQLAPTTPAATDFWTQGGSAVLAPPMPAGPTASAPGMSAPPPPKLSPLKRAHRLLRGRYPLAITLAALTAVAGGMLGYAAVAPRYTSAGVVTIDPRIVTTGFNDSKLGDVNFVIANQMAQLTGGTLAEAAMSDRAYVDAFHKAYPGEPLPDSATFVSGIGVERNKNTTLINVTYSDKAALVAETAAAAVMRSYQQMYGNDDSVRNIAGKLDYDRKLLRDIGADLTAKNRDLDDLVRQFGGQAELDQYAADLRLRWLANQTALSQQDDAYQDAVTAAKNGQGGANPELVYQQIVAAGDLNMRNHLEQRYTARANLDAMAARNILPGHPAYQTAQLTVRQAEKRVDDYAREFLVRNPNAIVATLDGNGKSSLDTMKARVDKLRAQVQKDQQDVSRLAVEKKRVVDLNGQIADLAAERKRLNDVVTSLTDTQQLSKIISVTMPGEPVKQSSRRAAVSAVLFLLGGLLPIGGMMLYGLGDSRFRYSDEASEADLAGVALLGILPNLPDRLSDPQQAGIAAHCVHQIRTMLQISRANDEPQVLAVTSASTGDGKTSLSLALGLSYAACGARTLLVDCDLLAAGLTHRLNVSSPDGILEAVANRALLEYVRTTDIADVAILPVGTTHAHHASTLSPVALRRLLSEAKKQFDIVIVDTGPILASIEASLICAAADRTVLAVARNQQRPLVERSIGHLQAIGANLAGVVFNRAQAKDFEKSMSGLALRSRPAAGNPAAGGNTANGQSVAKAVAGSFKRAG